MARTLNPEAHALKRDAFVDTALRLSASKTYEDLSIQDVLDDLGTSKGAFYHYFDSKGTLLAAMVDRMSDIALAGLTPAVMDPDIPAVKKLKGLFSGIAQWKVDRMDLMLKVLRVWFSDGNTVVREQLRRTMETRLTPLLATIIRQGREESTFTVNSPEATAGVLVSLLQGASETASRLFLARRANAISYEEVERTLGAYSDAYERILGLPPRSVTIGNEATLRLWFS